MIHHEVSGDHSNGKVPGGDTIGLIDFTPIIDKLEDTNTQIMRLISALEDLTEAINTQ